MAKNFKTLREKMSPESRERSRALAAKYRAEMPLDELREALEITQVHLARILKVNQAAVSKMERRTDMYVSTLQDFIKAMGGELKITAKFPDGTVEISQFADAKKAAAGKSLAKMGHPPVVMAEKGWAIRRKYLHTDRN